MNKHVRLLLFSCLIIACRPLLADDLSVIDEYQPGHGWQVPGTSFRLGGYTSEGIENDKNQPWNIGINNLSLFVWWDGEGKLKLFSELDLENPLLYEQGNNLTVKHDYLALERAYADYLFSERFNLRGGKFLTPIGRWNTIHAAPLVWTTSRPLITERTFPTNATGVMAYGTLPVGGNDVDYSVYSAVGKDWRPDPKLDPFEEAYGAHVSIPVSGHGELGMSYANFEQKREIGERKNLIGLDYYWEHNRYEISSELAYRFSDNGSQSNEGGMFIQAVVPVSERWYVIGRYELYEPAGPLPTMNLGLLGLAKRLSPATIFKLEFSHASHNQIQAPEGFFTSFAILF